MKELQVKIVTMVLIAILITLLIPVNVFAAEANIQVVKEEDGDYIIYVEGLAKTEFKFAISTEDNATDSDLNYIKSVEDGDKNQVALIEKGKVATGINYIYIKNKSITTVNAIDFSDETQVFDIEKMQKVEMTTNRIETTLLTDLEERNEVIDGIQYKETVGGLEIKASKKDENFTDIVYYYKSEKLPAEKYSKLQELADELNSEAYAKKEMYAKIQFAKEFYNLYEGLIKDVETAAPETEAGWKTVKNMIIRQPIEAQKDDRYVVLIKKVEKNEKTTYDAKFLLSYREKEKEKIPGRTETIVVQETAKLPITGDSFALLVILAIVVVALIIVFIKMKKLKVEESEK